MRKQTMRMQIALTVLLYVNTFSLSIFFLGWNIKAVAFANILFIMYCLVIDDLED